MKALRRHSDWTPITKYYRTNLIPCGLVHVAGREFNLMRMSDTSAYYLVNPVDKAITRLPRYLALTLKNNELVTYTVGPYIFINGFEETGDGKYLISMLPHWFNRKPVVENKINTIMNYASWWCRINNETLKLMNKWVGEKDDISRSNG